MADTVLRRRVSESVTVKEGRLGVRGCIKNHSVLPLPKPSPRTPEPARVLLCPRCTAEAILLLGSVFYWSGTQDDRQGGSVGQTSKERNNDYFVNTRPRTHIKLQN